MTGPMRLPGRFPTDPRTPGAFVLSRLLWNWSLS